MIDSCIFCKIIARQIPSSFIKETNDLIVIKDLYPKAPVHYLIIPKKHLKDLQSCAHEESDLMSSMLAMSQELSKELPGSGDFKMVVNSGKGAGQQIFHLHFHFLAGKQLGGI